MNHADWPALQAAAKIPFDVIDGHPVNPCERTGRKGQDGFWHLGESLMADAIVTACTRTGSRTTRYLLMVERSDGHGWAVPGGHVEPGETGLQAALRELAEETGLDAMAVTGTVMVTGKPRYVPDPRATDEAWAVTIPVRIDLVLPGPLPAVKGADDARRAEWVPAGTYDELAGTLQATYGGRVFAAHVPMLRELLAA